VYAASSREIRYIHLSVGKLFWGYHVRFSPANLPETLCVVVGADMSSYWAPDAWPCGIGGTWKQEVAQLLLGKVLPAKQQKIGPSN
jgi:hypothetical protein